MALPEIDFTHPPKLGYEHVRYGQTYVVVELTPYIRKGDGQPTTLIRWYAECAACRQPFGITTGLRAQSLNRRCKDCAQPLRPSSVEAYEALQRARKEGRARAKAARRRRP